MPGIDFAELRVRVSMEQVLELIDFHPVQYRGSRLRGPCPFDCGGSPRDFVANLDLHRYHCFHCHRRGDQLQLWAALHGLTCYYQAACDLCRQLHIDPPLIHRW
jgi:DNA primase